IKRVARAQDERDILVRNSYHLCRPLFPLSLLILFVLDGQVDEKKRDETLVYQDYGEYVCSDDKYAWYWRVKRTTRIPEKRRVITLKWSSIALIDSYTFTQLMSSILKRKWKCLPNISTAGAAAVGEYTNFHSFDYYKYFYIKILLKNIKHLQRTKIHITFYKNNLLIKEMLTDVSFSTSCRHFNIYLTKTSFKPKANCPTLSLLHQICSLTNSPYSTICSYDTGCVRNIPLENVSDDIFFPCNLLMSR
ncbi:hypothetical protein ALC56_05152, partial [Trachymyrmex septentrionalis]